MDHFFSLIPELNPTKTSWAICVQLVHGYIIPVEGNPNLVQSIELILGDKDGFTIHASISGTVLNNLRQMPDIGQIYAMKNFTIVPNTMELRTTEHEYMLIFRDETMVKEMRGGDFLDIGSIMIANASNMYHFQQETRIFKPANIDTIDALRKWCELACKKCLNWLHSSRHFVLCNKCGPTEEEDVCRYKIAVIVTDVTSTKRLSFWEREVVHLIGE